MKHLLLLSLLSSFAALAFEQTTIDTPPFRRG